MAQSQKRSIHEARRAALESTGVSVPLMWPMLAAAKLAQEGLEIYARNLKFLREEIKIHHELRPNLATPNRPMLALRTMIFRDYSAAPQKTFRRLSMHPMPATRP